MNRGLAWGIVALLAGFTVASLLLPPWAVAVLASAGIVALRRGRLGLLAFTAVNLALSALLLGLFVDAGPDVALGPVALDVVGVRRGLVAALRLTAILAANLAVLSWLGMERILDGLGLPAKATAFLAAVLIAAHDVGRDAARLVAARRVDGQWPRSRPRAIVAAAALLPPLLVVSLRRAQTRRDALRLAGHDMPPNFAPIVAVTALAVAGRMAFVAVPNVSPTYAAVFLGGLLFGPAVGAWSGLAAMAFTDLLLSGLAPTPFANAPAMALVGAMGGGLRGWRDAPRATLATAAAACGLLATAVFSLASDLLTWLVVPEFRGTPGTLAPLLLAGLAFNVVPAITNAVLFAAAAGPTLRAARAAGLAGALEQPLPGPAATSPST